MWLLLYQLQSIQFKYTTSSMHILTIRAKNPMTEFVGLRYCEKLLFVVIANFLIMQHIIVRSSRIPTIKYVLCIIKYAST